MTQAVTLQTTKVFKSGENQAMCIPMEFMFQEDELYVNKIGNTLMLTPRSELLNSLEQGVKLIPEDFMEDGMPEEIQVIREAL